MHAMVAANWLIVGLIFDYLFARYTFFDDTDVASAIVSFEKGIKP